MRIIFYSTDTPRVIFLPRDHLKKGGRKGVRSLSFEWLSSIKNWWKKHIVTTCLSWEQIGAPLSRNLPDLKRYVNRIPLTWSTHFMEAYKLVTVKMKLCGPLKKKMKKWKSQKIAMCFSFQTRCCKIRIRWTMRIIFYSRGVPYFVFFISWSSGKRGAEGVALTELCMSE